MAASTSYNQNPSSSTSWDVFLSFRGSDTRNTFTGHLYKDLCRNGIKTFKDDPELLSGEVISRALPQAIQESKTYVLVLSENYASSSWCLEELVEILRCYKQMNRLVVPVFYYVHPSVVRHQKGSFEKAFDKHQTRYDVEKVEEWRLTLKEVADFSGYHVSENRSESDIIDEVVSRILLEINPKTLHVATYPVGLDSRVKALTTLFNSDNKGVVRIGIYGMGGVGKTTLAKAVYNQKHLDFPGSCFLANVREVSRTEQGRVCLQQQLLNNVLKRKDITIDTADQGIEVIRERICSTKVLVVIDDLDDPKHLKYLEGSFALGSIVIITTRYEDLLDKIEVKAKYKVNQMDEDESLRLFTRHAFGEDKKLHTFPELSKEVLEHAGGLPLALQVFGSALFNESEDGWKMFIKKLKRAPIDDIEENLMISFDALKLVDADLQDIFLDIACLYIGWNKKEVVKILETCYTFVNHKLDILRKRCLITINDKDEDGEPYEYEDKDEDDDGEHYGDDEDVCYVDKLGMHDLLCDMGRKIACNYSPDDHEKYSRLWVREDIDTVLKHQKGTEAIRAIMSDYHLHWFYKKEHEGVTFDAGSFKRMNKLKFLFLNSASLTGSFEQTFEDLRWLRWLHCPLECLPSKFYPQKLVFLDLRYSNLRTMGEQNMVFKMLKTLDMSDSPNLITAPDFNMLPCLETLNLRDCRKLKSLPASICNLRALKVLNVGCSGLEVLPTELGNIESLKELRAGSLCLSKLPDSIGRLSNLVKLDLSFNRILETLPDSICNLRSLEILNVCYCEKLEELPHQIGMITSLRILKLQYDTMLTMLPDISQLSNIENLYLLRCSNLLSISELPLNLECIWADSSKLLERLPDLSSLKHLKHLDLDNCEALKEIQGLEEVTSLEYLFLEACRSLERLPNLCNLRHLKALNLSECSGLKEIQGLEEVTSLEYLCLYDCRSLERLPNLCNLKKLEVLDISYLEFYFGGNLYSLSASKLPPNLKRVRAEGCTSLKRFSNLSNLKQLEILELRGCSGLTDIQGLEELTSLLKLDMGGCNLSLLACTFTNRFFEILSGFGHKIQIFGEIRFRWMKSGQKVQRFDEFGWKDCYRLSFDLQPNASHNFLGILLAFAAPNFADQFYGFELCVKNVTSGFKLDDAFPCSGKSTLFVIVPSSIFSIRGGDRIEVTINKDRFFGIQPLYKKEIPMISKCCSTTNNVDDERSYPLHSDLEINRNWLSLGSSRTTVNVEEQRSNPSDNDLESNNNWLSLGSSGTTGEERNRNEKRKILQKWEHTESDNNWLSLSRNG